MISRRLLRIKVLQELYALHKTDVPSIMQFEKELIRSIEKTYDLYRIVLLLIAELQAQAEQRIARSKARKLPAKEDLNPNVRFVENKTISILRRNWSLSQFVKESKFSWRDHPEFVKELFNTVIQSELYCNYMAAPVTNFEIDKKFVLDLLDEFILNSEVVDSWLEEQSIYWNDDLEYAGSMAAKTVDRIKDVDGQHVQLMNKFKNQEDEDFFKILFRKSAVNAKYYNELIQHQVENWDVERIAFMDVINMQMAICEMIEFPAVPIKVSLNEYLEISKNYSTDKSSVFINGILDKIIITLKNDKIVVKTGRGLIGDEETVGSEM